MKVLIMAGGTGGHVFPALAVADELKARGHDVVWMGAPHSFESKRVPAHGIPMEFIRVSGLRGKGVKKLLTAPLLILRALRDALAALRRQRPQVVLGMGGFAAGPGGLAAWLTRRPLVIHEQNAAAGLTNRLLARIARNVLEAFPQTFRRALAVGNPVRAGFILLPRPSERLKRETRRVLVVGGSQGARAFNERMPEALKLIPADRRPEVRHQAGRTLDIARDAYAKAGVSGEVRQFIDDMPEAFAWADLVLCRAGASTIAELAAAGCASILVPYPHAVDDHQTRNAEYLASAGAAILIQEADLTVEKLAQTLDTLLSDRARLISMAEAARTRAWPNATNTIVESILGAAA
ncbi:MAG TPA: undecaprenyldiphospho-muramoylpentapeptide beta-N-acetylglucosaminyltransferase [Nevskiaceae bacterium]|nr:undecaprenyldiphospho-muramoylpentapeptide beta-N-acetylglucosaminyltransferase [Nevskiaceae bacterium]